MKEAVCPVCSADVILSGDEKAGDMVLCSYCSSPLKIRGFDDRGDVVLKEDY